MLAVVCVFMICDADGSDADPASGQCGDNLYWSMDSDKCVTFTGSGDMWDYTITDERGWKDCSSVILPDGLTNIGELAFYYCSSLESVTIPDSVTSIKADAFRYCESLASVTVPDSVTSIGNGAFNHCASLASVTIPDSVTTIGNLAFEYCELLESVTIPDSVTSIGYAVFYRCSSLASVTIPDSVTSIGEIAFYGCSSLASVTIPDSVTSIGDSAFFDCSSLASVTIPDSVTSVGESAFRYCSSLASVTIPDSVTSIGTYAFQGCNSLTTLYIPCNNPLGITANDSVNNGGISQNVDEDNLFLIHDYSATYTWADDGKSCTVDIACSHGDTENHQEHPDVAHTVKIPPTETEMGTTAYSVSGTYDDFTYSDTKDVQDIPPTGKPGGSNDGTLVYIAAGGAVAAIALIGGAFFLLRKR